MVELSGWGGRKEEDETWNNNKKSMGDGKKRPEIRVNNRAMCVGVQ